MSAIKEHFHDEIEKASRIYTVVELEKLTMEQLCELAQSLEIKKVDKNGCRQIIIYDILKKQAE